MKNIDFNFNVLCLELTKACTNRCKYCYQQGKKIYGNMSKEVIEASLNYFESLPGNQYHISLLGGEPTLWIDTFLEVFNKYKQNSKKEIGISLNTNGLMFNEELCNKLKPFNPRVAVSLDGPKESHDYNRIDAFGKGTYDKLINKIPLILTNFPLNFCQATFTPETIKDLSNSYFLAKELGFAEWYWAPDIYNSNWTEEHFQIIKSEMNIIAQDYFCQKEILYKPFEKNEHINKGNLRFRNDSHCLVIDPDGLARISRLNATKVSQRLEQDWYIGNIKEGLDQNKINNWINKYGINADQLYYAYNSIDECIKCCCNSICFNPEHKIDNPYLYQIQCQQPRIQCEQKKIITTIYQNFKNL